METVSLEVYQTVFFILATSLGAYMTIALLRWFVSLISEKSGPKRL